MEIRRLFDPLVKRFRNKLRFYLRPRSADESEDAREIFSRIYLLTAFGLFVFQTIYTGIYNIDIGGKSSTQAVAERLNIQKPVTVVHYKGFTKVNEYVFDPNNPTDEKVEKESESQQQ